MSLVQRIKCDCCNAERRWWLEADRNPTQIPEGWWSLCESDSDPVHFCSRDCLYTWVQRWTVVRADRLPVRVAS